MSRFVVFACNIVTQCHPCCSPAFHLASRWQLTCLRIIVLQVQASLIRIRYTRYYVDDNGCCINIHAGDAHKCYRRRVQSVRYIRYTGGTRTGISVARVVHHLGLTSDPWSCWACGTINHSRRREALGLTIERRVLAAIHVWFISKDGWFALRSLRVDRISSTL